mgnify:CR=1 FL=1
MSLTWPRQVFAVAALLTLLGTILGLPPEVDGNLIMLLPEDDPYATSLRQMHDERVESRSPFDLEDPRDGSGPESHCRQPVDGLRGEGHQFAPFEGVGSCRDVRSDVGHRGCRAVGSWQ